MNVDTGEARHRQSRESRDEAWEGATIQSPGTTQSLVNLEMLLKSTISIQYDRVSDRKTNQ